MSDALKPLSAALAALAAGSGSTSAAATASVSAASLPAALANLASGNMLAGIVVERGRGTVLLKTDKGVIQLATMLPLKLGASVVLEVQSIGAQVRFAIVSVDHRGPQAAANDIELPPETTVSSSRGDGSVPATPVSTRAPLIGRIVTAEIVAPPDLHAATPGDAIPTLLRRVATLTASLGNAPADPRAAATTAPVPLPAAETLETILAAIEALPPETAEALLGAEPKTFPAPAKAPGTTASAETLPGRETQAATSPSAPRGDVAPAPASTRANQSPPTGVSAPTAGPSSAEPAAINPATPKLIAIRVLDILPPALADARSLPSRPTGDSITLLGNVVAADADHVTLATPLGTLRLPIAAGVPVGSRMAFEVLVSPHVPNTAGAPPSANESLPPLRTFDADPPGDWPALRELVAALPPDGDAAAILPRPGPTLGPALLAFLVGLRGGGNVKAWLGTAADSLESSDGTRLVDRLRDDLSVQARAVAMPDRNGWQTMAVPLLDGGRLAEIRVHVQKRRKADTDGEEPGSRFIVEATLSALGPLQLDGLVRASRFDLIVRTQRPLPPPVRSDIETLFRESLSDTAYSGGVSFRGDARTSPITGARGGNGVVV